MSAEQRKQFEVFLATWFDVYDWAMLAPKELSSLKAAFEAGYLSRDAEVQALREALAELVECAEDAAKRLPYPRGSLDYAIWQGRKALAGGETGETE